MQSRLFRQSNYNEVYILFSALPALISAAFRYQGWDLYWQNSVIQKQDIHWSKWEWLEKGTTRGWFVLSSKKWIALWRYLFLSTDSRDTLDDWIRLDLAFKHLYKEDSSQVFQDIKKFLDRNTELCSITLQDHKLLNLGSGEERWRAEWLRSLLQCRWMRWLVTTYMNVFWSNNANQSRFCPLGPHSPLPALVPWFTAHLHCCSFLKSCAKNGNATGTTSTSLVVFLRWRKIFLNLDHLNDLISAQLNKQLPQHKCPVSGGIWAAIRGRAVWQKTPESPLLPEEKMDPHP